MDDEFARLVFEAAARAEVREAVGRVYADVEAEIAARRPVCVASGRCCRFEEFGHRLFVTTLELAAFAHAVRGVGSDPRGPWDGRGCPFQAATLCGVHAVRPFGCRMYFCDATSTAWQNEAYEKFHARLTRLHEDLGVPYRYVEWRQSLRMIGLVRPAPEGAGGGDPGPRNLLPILESF